MIRKLKLEAVSVIHLIPWDKSLCFRETTADPLTTWRGGSLGALTPPHTHTVENHV